MSKKQFRYYLIVAIFSVLSYFGIITVDTWTSVRFPTPLHPTEFYANQMRDDLRSTITGAMKQAEKSIVLMIYSLTDHQVINALNQKANEGIDVLVVCDSKASSSAFPRLSPKVKISKQRPKGLMHQKILVVDGDRTWVGSANMTTESLRMHGNLMIGIHDQEMGRYIHKKALHMDKEYPHQTFAIGDHSVEFYFLPDDKNGAERIMSLIKQARKSLKIAMFTWTHNELAEAVIAAHKRGVQVEVVMDRYSGRGASRTVVDMLRKEKIPVSFSQGQSLLHYKMMVVDDETIVNGSANWTKAAFTQNNDCFMVMKKLSPSEQKTLTALWELIRDEAISTDHFLDEEQRWGAAAIDPLMITTAPHFWIPLRNELHKSLFF